MDGVRSGGHEAYVKTNNIKYKKGLRPLFLFGYSKMKHVTFNETTYILFIENRADIEDKTALWWTYSDFIVFRERQILEDLLLFTFYDDEDI